MRWSLSFDCMKGRTAAFLKTLNGGGDLPVFAGKFLRLDLAEGVREAARRIGRGAEALLYYPL
jgi:hypothetical protein